MKPCKVNSVLVYTLMGELMSGFRIAACYTIKTINRMQTHKKNEQHKRAFVAWLAIYPLITVILYISQELLMTLPLALKTMIITLIVVPLMSYLVMPLFNRIFGKWLEK